MSSTCRIAIVLAVFLSVPGTVEAKRPNFVFFLVDDLGFMDIEANHPETFYETPNINRLAAQAMRFTNGYAANPVCSPTRYSIMTGKHPTRIGATNFFSGTRFGRFLPAELHSDMPLEEVTIAEALRAANYRTAFLGKWHLGPTEEFWPRAQGFEINVGGNSRGLPRSYFSPYQNPRLEDGPDGEHLPERLADEALKILDRFANEPFLLYFSFYSVHTPLQAPRELIEKYQNKASDLATANHDEFADEEQVWPIDQPRRVRVSQRHATYAAMVESMDRSVGRVLAHLKQLGLDQDTVVFFFSDNGGLSTSEGSPTSNLPLRGGKGWLYEGGIREPMIVKWPGVTAAGSICDQPVCSMDFYPTILELAGLPPAPQQHRDGVSLVPLLQQSGVPARDALFWHYPHYSNQGGFPGAAIRVGDFKLIERFEDGRLHLYNLQEDIGERHDLAAVMPDRVQMMRDRLHAWYKQVDAKFLRAKPGGAEPWAPQ